MSVTIENLGALSFDGQETVQEKGAGTHLFKGTICHQGLKISVISLGASVQDIRLLANDKPLVLGYQHPRQYQNNPCYLGSMVGRCANRIAYGKTHLQGQPLQLARHSELTHHLHGGPNGSANRNWHMQSMGDNALLLEDTLPDGHMGYPGNLKVQVIISVGKLNDYQHPAQQDVISGAYIDVQIRATCDAVTLCNFTPHWYFNLGDVHLQGGQINQHYLQVHADSYLATDHLGIPTPCPTSLDNNALDLRQTGNLPHYLTDALLAQLDHNYCLRQHHANANANEPNPLLLAATLSCDNTCMSMTLLTNQQGLQVYGGQSLSIPAQQTISGTPYTPFSGIALEPQGWPDAPNNKNFPSVTLQPQQAYFHHDRYEFRLWNSSP